MAEVTLQNVIERMKEEGDLTRTKSPDSLKVAIGELKSIRTDFTDELKNIRTDFGTFFEIQKQQANLAALADPVKDSGGGGVSGTVEPSKTPAPAASDKNSLGLLGGLFGLIGGLGKGIGGAMKGIAGGLVAFANPAVVAGAVGLGASIVAIGAGISGAAWIAGKLLPTFVEGMKSFEELDGKKLIDAGAGIAAVGAGMAVFGVGGAAAGIGNIVSNISDGLVSLFGGKTPFDKVLEFQKYDFNKNKIQNNSEAMVAYGVAMAAFGVGETAKGIGSAVGAIGDGIAGLFGKEKKLPFQDVVDFGEKYSFNKEKIQANADALVAYSTAMAKYAGISAGASLLGAVGAVGDGIAGLFGKEKKPPFQDVQDFANNYTFNKEKIQANAEALVAYSSAMAKYAGISAGASLLNAVGAVGDGIAGLFGKSTVPPFQSVQDFGDKYTFNKEKIQANADALVAYSSAMAKYADIKAGASVSTAVGAIGDGIAGLFGKEKKLPFQDVVAFGDTYTFNKEKIEANAGALVAYSTAMAKYADIKAGASVSTAVGAIGGAITGLFGGNSVPPFQSVQDFGDKYKFNKEQIELNGLSLAAFGKAMADYASVKPKAGFGDVLSSLASGIMGFFGGEKESLPYDEIKKFGEVKFDLKGVTNNAKVVEMFGKSLSSLAGLKVVEDIDFGDIGSDITSGINVLSRVKDDNLDKATNVIKKIRAAFGGASDAFASAATGATGDQIEEMSTQNAAAAAGADGNTVIAPTTVGPTYNGPVYNGPVTITYDNATTLGLDPNKMGGNSAYPSGM